MAAERFPGMLVGLLNSFLSKGIAFSSFSKYVRQDSWTDEGSSKYISYICSAYKDDVPFKNVSNGGAAFSTFVEKSPELIRLLFFATLIDDAKTCRRDDKRILDIVNRYQRFSEIEGGFYNLYCQ